jgi:acyl transferase domain-containing protein
VALAATVPGASLVAGAEDAVAALRNTLADEGVRATALPGAHAHQTPMMEAAVEPFRRRVEAVRREPPRTPLLSAATGRWLAAGEAADAGYWAGQLTRPVRFAEQVEELARVPERVFLEVGDGTALATLARRDPACAERAVVSTLAPLDAAPDPARFLRAAAELWCAGAPVKLPSLHVGERRRRVPLPGYPFQRRRCWFGHDEEGG